MSLLGRLTAPLRGYRLLRRLLAEARALRRAADRIADALELQAGAIPRGLSTGGQTFRSFTRTKGDLAEQDVRDLTAVDYVSNAMQAQYLAKEDELRAVLGRDPSPEEVLRATAGDIE